MHWTSVFSNKVSIFLSVVTHLLFGPYLLMLRETKWLAAGMPKFISHLCPFIGSRYANNIKKECMINLHAERTDINLYLLFSDDLTTKIWEAHVTRMESGEGYAPW